MIDMPWRNEIFQVRSSEKIRKGSTLIFVDTQISLKYSVGLVKRSPHAKKPDYSIHLFQ